MYAENIQEMICRNQKEYQDNYETMKWLSQDQAQAASRLRKTLINSVFSSPYAGWKYSQTKLHTHAISPGCAICGQGEWSCLFINGICNARCFYCPSSQDDPGQPMANTLIFDNPKDYADYVCRFNIKGVSFSGGEPFLTFDRVLKYLEVLKARTDHPVYTWMYTNGLLVTGEKLAALRDSGLDEIRFDISANFYRLKALEKAVGIIPRVTVEIPAIPEDLPSTKKLINILYKSGVDHLNLHQIRCTPFNSSRLINRGYTFVHGPRVTVLETELAALELIQYSLDQSIALPINYCSFTYRNQFQGAGARKRYSLEIKAAYEDITSTGHIRHMKITGTREIITGICQTLLSAQVDSSLYSLSGEKDSLSFAAGLWHLIDFSCVRLKIVYSTSAIRPGVTYYHPFKQVPLNPNKTVVIERQVVQPGIWMEGEQIQAFGCLIIARDNEQIHKVFDTPAPDLYRGILPFEIITPGLAQYY
ncbi:radical SAM protein [Desulfobacula toluolica]|uniref:Radical SAM domain protein n=1 Tax=Desulfobacula toluolica (strain DSM 7467 / Tol2) TaxID=651182 RepID=K0NFK8_DESTT|nr:radical SAM protein [Desulfobacula toluolica]CCK78488.1 radical SAM domain protein [Desulfobacula toluolica Tol2]